MITGVLEHILFELEEKNISYTLNYFSPEQGFKKQLVLRFQDIFLYIIKHSQRIVYKWAESSLRKQQISREDLLKYVKKLVPVKRKNEN